MVVPPTGLAFRFAVLALLYVAATAAHADPILVGTWTSDGPSTTKFNEEHVKLSSNTIEFERQVFGHMTVTFSEKCAEFAMPDLDVTVGEKPFHLVGFREIQPYQVLGSTERLVAVKIVIPVAHRQAIVTYHFDDSDRMWVLVDETVDRLSPQGQREYFVRTSGTNTSGASCSVAR